jgi:hypothetical protein
MEQLTIATDNVPNRELFGYLFFEGYIYTIGKKKSHSQMLMSNISSTSLGHF